MVKIRQMSWEGAGALSMFTELKARSVYTPDMDVMETYTDYIPIFEYGIRKNYGNTPHPQFKGAKYLGEALTTSETFVMKEHLDFPYVFKIKHTSPSAKRILGQLFAVPIITLLTLDRSYNNNIICRRHKVYVKCMDQFAPFKQAERRPVIEAYMYIYDDKFMDMENMSSAPYRNFTNGAAYFYQMRQIN